MNLNISNYDYFLFVDASGDDGMKFDKDSSSCFVVCCFLVNRLDFEHNMSILTEIKKFMGYVNEKANFEVKYTSVRRYIFSNKILNQISYLKGELFSFSLFKKLVVDKNYQDVKSKFMSGINHAFSILCLNENHPDLEGRVLIVINRMKQVEMNIVKSCLISIYKKNDLLENSRFNCRNNKKLFRKV